MSMLDRCKDAVGASSDYQFAKWLDVSTPVVSGYKRRNSVPMEQCIKIATETGISLDWLILGQGSNTPSQLTDHNDKYDIFVSIPLYDITASAGNGCMFDDERIISELSFRKDWLHEVGLYQKDLVCLGVKGDSMQPTLQDGDTILVNIAKKTGDGIFLIRIGEQLRIKRLQWLADGNIKIISDNTLYDTEVINPRTIDGFFEIIGACHTRIGLVQ